MTALDHVKKALMQMSRIPVTDVYVDMMALARNELFQAIQQLEAKAECETEWEE